MKIAATLFLLMLVGAGCYSPSAVGEIASIMDTTGGFADPSAPTQTRLVLMENRDAYQITFALEPNNPGIRVVSALSHHEELIQSLMQPSARGAIPGATVHGLRTLGDENVPGLDAWAGQAGTKSSKHASNCADCFTYAFHHMNPGHSSEAYGFPDEFDAPWAAWAKAMDALGARLRNDGVSMANA